MGLPEAAADLSPEAALLLLFAVGPEYLIGGATVLKLPAPVTEPTCFGALGPIAIGLPEASAVALAD